MLARLTGYGDEDGFGAAAQAGIEYALSKQHPDGSWLYGERPDLAWVDGYHHGYVLDALRVCADAGLDDRLPEAIHRGLEFYRRELILPDGTPRYFSHETYPIDSQSVAQAIQTFSIAALEDPSYIEPARRVFDWSLRNMRRPDGLFMFQRRRHWSNPLPHIRWVLAANAARLHAPVAGRADACRGAGESPLSERSLYAAICCEKSSWSCSVERSIPYCSTTFCLPARPRRRR